MTKQEQSAALAAMVAASGVAVKRVKRGARGVKFSNADWRDYLALPAAERGAMLAEARA